MSKGPPLRLRDDPTAARALRDDLARTAANPSTAYDVSAGAAKFEQALRTGAGVGASAGAGAKAALGTAMKGLLLSAAVVGGAAALGHRSPAPSAAPPPPAVSVVPTAPAGDARSSAAPLPTPSSPPPLAPPKPPVVQAPVRDRGDLPTAAASVPRARAPALAEPAPPVVASASSAPRAPEPLASTGAGDTLAAEMEHLARLRALQGGNPREVLALAAEGNERFSAGLFAQEREAIAIGALVRLGRRTEARARARAFLASYPRSTFAERIKKLTEIGDTP